MDKYSDLIDLIYFYYPQNMEYIADSYQCSIEHKRLRRVLGDLDLRAEIDKKVFNVIQSSFPENYITKWTSIEYPSIHYSVLMHPNQPILDDDRELLDALNGIRFDYEIYISLLGNYFYTFVEKTMKLPHTDELRFSLEREEVTLSEEMLNLTHKLSSQGFSKINYALAHMDVPNVETELLYVNGVKVFNCLFSDLIKNF